MRACNNNGQRVEHVDIGEGEGLVRLACALRKPIIAHAVLNLGESKDEKHRESNPVIGYKYDNCLGNRSHKQGKYAGAFPAIGIW